MIAASSPHRLEALGLIPDASSAGNYNLQTAYTLFVQTISSQLMRRFFTKQKKEKEVRLFLVKVLCADRMELN